MKKMGWWVYKCNSRNLPHQHAYGDWRDFFNIGKEQHWGSTDWVPALKNLTVGDHVIAYQSDRNELVGLATVTQTSEKDTYIYLKPLERIEVKVRPLKKANPKIASIPALQPGPIKAIYEISDSDARRLLKAAGARYAIPLDRGNQTKQKRLASRTSGGGFGDIVNNVEVETAGINFVKQFYRKDGWEVESVERERCGFDLRCKKSRSVLEVEVKGVTGTTEAFIITAGEVSRASSNPNFVLCVVTGATSGRPKLSKYSGKAFLKRFALDPIQMKTNEVVNTNSEELHQWGDA